MGKQAIPGAKRGNIFYHSPFRVTIVGRDVSAGPEHPLYDERAERPINEARVKNIRVYGVIDAVKVRKNGVHKGGEFDGEAVLEVVDGRGRVIDCREAHRQATEAGEDPPLLKIEVVKGDEDVAVGVMVSSNEQRDDDKPLNRARKAMRIMANGRSVKEVAEMFGVSRQTINNWRLMVEMLSKKVHAAIDKELITASAALELKDLSHAEQDKKLTELLASGGSTSSQQVKNAANGNKPVVLKFNKGAAKKLVDDEAWMGELSPDAAALARFIAGDEEAIDQVPGLKSRLKKMSREKAKKAKAKAEKGAQK